MLIFFDIFNLKFKLNILIFIESFYFIFKTERSIHLEYMLTSFLFLLIKEEEQTH